MCTHLTPYSMEGGRKYDHPAHFSNVYVGSKCYPGVSNIGIKPTIRDYVPDEQEFLAKLDNNEKLEEIKFVNYHIADNNYYSAYNQGQYRNN